MNEQQKVIGKIISQILERKFGISYLKYEPIIEELAKAINDDLKKVSLDDHRPRLQNSKSAAAIRDLLLQSMYQEWGKSADRYDPLVEKMAGALATEIEHVYFELNTRIEHLMLNMAKTLIPDEETGPIPAYGVAKASVNKDYITLSKQDTLYFSKIDPMSQAERKIFFSPLVTTHLFKGQIKFLLTNQCCYKANYSNRFRNISAQNIDTDQVITNILIGIEAPETLKNLAKLVLFIDFSDTYTTADNQVLLHSITEGSAYFNGQPTTIELGITNDLEQSTYHRSISETLNLKTRKNFISIQPNNNKTDSDPEFLAIASNSKLDYLEDFCKCHTIFDWESTKEISIIKEDVITSEKNIFWLQLNFLSPVKISHFETRFYAAIDHFPIINCKREMPISKYFDENSPSIIQISSKEQFLSIDSVVDENSGDQLHELPFSSFSPDKIPSYSIRRNGVGRMDNYNSWKRFKYLFSVFKKEYKYKELVKLIGKDFLLSELERMINDKDAEQGSVIGGQENVYVMIAAQKKPTSFEVTYSICQGEKANNLQENLVPELSIPGLGDVKMISETEGGKDGIDSLRAMSELKATLSHTKSINTDYQLRIYCERFFQETQIEVQIKKGMLFLGNSIPTRSIEVHIKPQSNSRLISEARLALLEEELNFFSISSLPIKTFLQITSD